MAYPLSFEDLTRCVLVLLVEQGYIGFDLERLDCIHIACILVAVNEYISLHRCSYSLVDLVSSTCAGPKPTQKQLLQQLYNTVPDKWQPIGIYLEIPAAQLKTIDAQHRGVPQECLMTMLTEKWLPRVSPPATWQDLAEAVEFVGYQDVAQKLRDKFCK